MAQEQAISSAVTQASGSIDAEVARAKAPEAALDAKIQSEARQRVEADTVLGSGVSTEAAARQQGDADTLSAAKAYAGAGLSTEGAARLAADAAQQAALSTEAAARAGGDASTLAAAKAYADGLKVRVAVEPAGANCPTGGAMIADGANVAYACNGQSGESFAMCTYIWGEFRLAGTACGSGASDGRTRVCDGAGASSLCVPNAGASPRFVTNFGVEFGTVTDRSTCLVWEKKTGNVGIDTFCTSSSVCPNPHDVNNRYTWSTGSQYWNLDGTAATVFLTQLNDGGFAGHTDWHFRRAGGTGNPALRACSQSWNRYSISARAAPASIPSSDPRRTPTPTGPPRPAIRSRLGSLGSVMPGRTSDPSKPPTTCARYEVGRRRVVRGARSRRERRRGVCEGRGPGTAAGGQPRPLVARPRRRPRIPDPRRGRRGSWPSGG